MTLQRKELNEHYVNTTLKIDSPSLIKRKVLIIGKIALFALSNENYTLNPFFKGITWLMVPNGCNTKAE